MSLKIVSNYQKREVIYWNDLSSEEQKDFDYLKDDDSRFDVMFVRYMGRVYGVSHFMRTENNSDLKNWDGYLSETYFSGVLVKICKFDEVIMGMYLS